MAKSQNTFAKRLREMEKKRKADEKRARRQKKKEQGKEQPEPNRVDATAMARHETEVDAEPAPLRTRVVNLLGVTLPFAGLLAAGVLLWETGCGWVPLGLLVGMYVLTVLGITVGFHRLFTHRSFETSRTVAFILGVLGSMAVQGPVLRWVARHRRHHQNSDKPGDPHSPHLQGRGVIGLLRGVWHSHVGWLFDGDPANLSSYIPDLSKNGVIRTVSRLFPLWVAIGLIIPAALGGLLSGTWTGALLGFIWGGLVRVFFAHHITWSVNSVCHLWGTQPFSGDDRSKNNLLFGLLALGEGWHNNHHAFPTSARHGLKWWQVDLSYWVIRLLELVRLARNVRVPSGALLAARRR
jgi:stearoyl-CoA desaturase (delta-9 desaturase)